MDSEPRFALTPRHIVGLGIAFVGLSLVLDRLHVVHADRLLRYWPVGLILIGGILIVQPDGRSRTRGILFAGIGTWLFLAMQDLLPWRFWDLFWPVLLIFLGLSMVMRPSRRMRYRGPDRWPSGPPTSPTSGGSSFIGNSGPGESGGASTNFSASAHAGFSPNVSGYASLDNSPTVSIFSVMSGVKRISNASPFRGGDITAFMGGAHLDLRMAQIPPGGEAVIDVTTIMGGVEIAVPSTWAVATSVMPFMGAVEDKRLPPLPIDGRIPVPDAQTPRLVIRGFVMMGNVELKS